MSMQAQWIENITLGHEWTVKMQINDATGRPADNENRLRMKWFEIPKRCFDVKMIRAVYK